MSKGKGRLDEKSERTTARPEEPWEKKEVECTLKRRREDDLV